MTPKGFLSPFSPYEIRDCVLPFLWGFFNELERDCAIRHAKKYIDAHFLPAKKLYADPIARIKSDVEHAEPRWYLSTDALTEAFLQLNFRIHHGGEFVYAKKRPLSRVQNQPRASRLH